MNAQQQAAREAVRREAAELSTDVRGYTQEFCLEKLRAMVRMRRLEERWAQLRGEAFTRCCQHLHIGEEAVAAGVMPHLLAQDNVVSTYGEHGHALLRGMPMKTLLAGILGRQEGCSRGRGGSAHLYDSSRRFYGGSAIAGAGLPLAAGLALADRLGGRAGCVTACFFGEGWVAEGVFHESINLAALWQLPVLFICENNLYTLGSVPARSQSQLDLAFKAASYGLPTAHINGMNVLAVHDAARLAVDAVRRRQSPFFLELHTYHSHASSAHDVDRSCRENEMEAWKQQGPVHTLTDKLKEAGMLSEAEFQRIDAQAQAEVSAAVAFAKAGTWETVEQLMQDVCEPPAPVLHR
jgi:pyruvate dehydrogenase E1 component alpha subunit